LSRHQKVRDSAWAFLSAVAAMLLLIVGLSAAGVEPLAAMLLGGALFFALVCIHKAIDGKE
jgi:hypothetical protein